MKLPCELVQDLLPLYHDGVCSSVSRTNVEEHLSGCEACRKTLRALNAEIEPVQEVEAAMPLGNIGVKWKKERWKTFLLGLSVTSVIAAALWWLLFVCRFVTIPAEDILIGERSVMENGLTVLQYTVPYRDAMPYDYVTEDGVRYTWFQSPLAWGKKLENMLPDQNTSYVDMEDFTFPASETWESVEIVAWYFGKPGSEDLVLFWEKGMELSPASDYVEQRYQELQERLHRSDAYQALNGTEDTASTDPTMGE